MLVFLTVILAGIAVWTGLGIGSGDAALHDSARNTRPAKKAVAIETAAWDQDRVSAPFRPPVRQWPKTPNNIYNPPEKSHDTNTTVKPPAPVPAPIAHNSPVSPAPRGRLVYNGYMQHGQTSAAVITLTWPNQHTCLPIAEGRLGLGLEIMEAGRDELVVRGFNGCIFIIPRGKEFLLQ